MNEDQNPFEEYYNETAKNGPAGETAKEILASLEAKASLDEKSKKIKDDANTIRVAINIFIKSMNALVGKVFEEENAKKTRTDLIVTMVIGGLAFTVANVYYLVTKNLKVKMTPEEYEITFVGMYQTAIKDIGKNENP
ncbi:MAG: hypothetical protein PHV33_13145 [Elusimicrobiales bacterium]|nr:hypothetical protein [Elusimicrobiales bacterium]